MFGRTVFGGVVSGFGMGPDGAFTSVPSQSQVGVTQVAHRLSPVTQTAQRVMPVSNVAHRLDFATQGHGPVHMVPSGIRTGGMNQRGIVIHGVPVLPVGRSTQPTVRTEAIRGAAMMANAGQVGHQGVFNAGAMGQSPDGLGGLGIFGR